MKNKPRKKTSKNSVDSNSPRKRGSAIGSHWTKTKRTKLNKDGWAPEGKLFYERVRLAVRGIPVGDWKEYWDEVWNVERMKLISERKKNRMNGSVQEDMLFVDEEREHMFSGDEEYGDQGDNETMLGI